MNAINSAVWWWFIALLFAAGAYGVWHSITATEFTARQIHSGFAKYSYKPNWYHRVLHFTVSLIFFILAIVGMIGGLWKPR